MADALRPAYLLTGSDRPKIARALTRLRGRFGEESVEHLFADAATGEDVVAACNALGLFGSGGRLVIVEAVDRWKAADAQAVAAYLADPTPETVLALVADALKTDAPLAKAVAKAGDVLAWDVPKRRVPGWVAEQFGRLGVEADREACETLVALVGDDLAELESEVEKIATWAGARAGYGPGRGGARGACARGPVVGALRCLGDARRRGGAGRLRGGPRTGPSPSSPARGWHRTSRSSAMPSGSPPQGRPHATSPRSSASTSSASARRWATPTSTRRTSWTQAVVRLADLDAALKGASRRPAELELELALVDVTRRA